jgi:hypothetical protein
MKKAKAGLIDGIILENRNAQDNYKNYYIRKAKKILKNYFPEEEFTIIELPKKKGQTQWLVTPQEKSDRVESVDERQEILSRILEEVDTCERFYERGVRDVPVKDKTIPKESDLFPFEGS